MIPIKRSTKGNVYTSDDKPLSNELVNRINKLRIPPGWKDVQISRSHTDYLQVTGIDVKGKTQYIYHPVFVELTTIEKFTRLKKFIKSVNSFMSTVERMKKEINIKTADNAKYRTYLICLMFKILYKTYLRVGNDGQDTYGLSTLQKRHVIIEGTRITFDFVGKRKVRNVKTVTDNEISKDLKIITENIKKTDNIFKDKLGNNITSHDLNEFLKVHMGEFTCKDFRTFASNVLFIYLLINKKEYSVPKVHEIVAKELCHTKAVSKKSYISSKIEELYKSNPKMFNGSLSPSQIILKM